MSKIREMCHSGKWYRTFTPPVVCIPTKNRKKNNGYSHCQRLLVHIVVHDQLVGRFAPGTAGRCLGVYRTLHLFEFRVQQSGRLLQLIDRQIFELGNRRGQLGVGGRRHRIRWATGRSLKVPIAVDPFGLRRALGCGDSLQPLDERFHRVGRNGFQLFGRRWGPGSRTLETRRWIPC